MTRGAAWAARATVLTLVAALLAACGATPTAQGPSGIDGLTIPTPSPDPADFTDRVTNPWFPLVPGTVWTYRRYTPLGSTLVLTATALATSRRIDGVATRPVRWDVRTAKGRVRTLAVRWYAQDTAGNVWWFGQQLRPRSLRVDRLATRSWIAGRGGAQAGLVLSAVPRVGDGYRDAFQQGVVERRTTVVSLQGTVATPRHTYRDTVVTHDLSRLDPILVVQSFYARGIGLVAQQTSDATTEDISLVRVTEPAG